VSVHQRSEVIGLLVAVFRGSRTGRSILALLALGAMLLLAVPLHDGAARLLMGKMHLRGPFLRWAVLQLVPSMYNFANVARIEIPGAEPAAETIWLNHYPLRAITILRRPRIAGAPATFTAQSRFGSLSVETRCRTEPRGGAIDVACEAVR